MDGRKEEVLKAEDAILRLGKEAERTASANRKLEEVTTQVIKAQEEVSGARKEILSFAESSAAMNKRTEELVNSLNSRYEAVENRLRGIDLEITAFRKSVENLESSVSQTAKDLESVRLGHESLAKQQGKMFIGLVLVVVVSFVATLVMNFL